MEYEKMHTYIKAVIKNLPVDWLNLTTHRLDIYDESKAKSQFLEQFESLFKSGNSEPSALNELPTAFDYIRLGHPLSCLLEWMVAYSHRIKADNVISFDSNTVPIMSILRKNLLIQKKTRILYSGKLPSFFNQEILQSVYGYEFVLKRIENTETLSPFEGSTIFISCTDDICDFNLENNYDFLVNFHISLGSVLVVNGNHNEEYVSEIQHVRRRETVAMTPANAYNVINSKINDTPIQNQNTELEGNRKKALEEIKAITETNVTPLVASSGLSIQYAIVIGLIDYARENHNGKKIKLIVPTNCYGGTNDQARRVAACIDGVEITDLHVDGEDDMVRSIDLVLDQVAKEDAIPYIIAEIPTNPRVEVPDLDELRIVLSKQRRTESGSIAIDPVFILDQTFCPNIHFLGKGEILSEIRAISYASGSKFPSGGKCTAGYCVANEKAEDLMKKIELHLSICDNEATPLQYKILSEQLPSMNKRIHKAYMNTRAFVSFIKETLPEAKINFVSEELAKEGFTPSVFSLDLPTKGNTDEEREMYKRALNLKLIGLMIQNIPNESKYCVSYGQLKGCYWTIPATSTQGTTKEGDKDYIARVALSPDMDLELHKKVFLKFVEEI